MSSLVQAWRQALSDPLTVGHARAALTLFKSYCSAPLPRVPGIATGDRLAIRIHAGKTVEEAAAREYLYRWQLAIKAGDQLSDRPAWNDAVSCFGTPHPIGF